MDAIARAVELGFEASARGATGEDTEAALALYRKAVKVLVKATRNEEVPNFGAQLASRVAATVLARAEVLQTVERDVQAAPRSVTPRAARLRASEVGDAATELERCGLVVFRRSEANGGCLAPKRLESLRAATAALEALVVDGTRTRRHYKGSSYAYAEAASRCSGRIDVKLDITAASGAAAAPSSGAHRFRDLVASFDVSGTLADNPWWRPLVDAALGDDAVLAYAGLVLSQPGSAEQPWHCDGARLYPTISQKSLPAHALNVFVPLVDVTRTRGPTELIPASHTGPAAKAVSAALEAGAAPPRVHAPTLNLGDVLVYDQRTVHRGVPNRSATTRPILYLLYARPWYRETLNFSKSSSLFSAAPHHQATTTSHKRKRAVSSSSSSSSDHRQ